MSNCFGNGQRPSIFQVARAYEDGNNGEIKPKTNVVINTNRLWYGEDSTASAFLATAYDEHGNKVDSMNGYFLEPATDYDLAKVAGKDKAIMNGVYNVIPQSVMLKKENERRRKNRQAEVKNLNYKWYIENPPGRSFIAIHSGETGEHTSGCFLPGDTIEYNERTQSYTVKNSSKKRDKLFNFFDKYGNNGIKINVGL